MTTKSTSALFGLPITKYSLTQLSHLAGLTGAISSPRKRDVLASSITDVVEATKADLNGSSIRPLRVLSIDMGIQNLAYCTLERPEDGSTPRILNWRRQSAFGISHDETKTSSFSSNEMAETSVALINTMVLSKPAEERPSHILIERQRWRSMGSRNVLQWTIRVNTLEAMLWASLKTLHSEGRWNGQIHAVDPARAMGMWLDKDLGKGLNSSQKYTAVKAAKVGLVRDWFQQGLYATSGCHDSEDISKLIIASGEVKQKRKKGEEKPMHSKLDDYADCLIQAVAWINWIENRETLARKGQDGIQELLRSHAAES